VSVSTPFGPFAWEDSCWVSEPVRLLLFDGAEVRIQVFTEQENDAVLADDQIEALQRFLALPRSHGERVVPHLWRYYQDVRADSEPADVPEISDPSTIWDHVQPRFITPRRDEHGVIYIVVEAECDWEIEHGLQLVLQEGTRWVRVSDYTDHLTDGRAYAKRFLDDWIADPSKTLPVRSLDDLCEAKE
jgi:hypothetical protein